MTIGAIGPDKDQIAADKRAAADKKHREAAQKAPIVSAEDAQRAATAAAPDVSRPNPNPLPRPGKTSGAGGIDVADEAREDRARDARRARIKVQATQLGYYDHTRRRAGDVFAIAGEGDYSDKWMRRVAADTPERTTLGSEALRRDHDQVLAMRSQSAGDRSEGTRHDAPTGDYNVLDA